MHVVLTSLGTDGDILPYAGLGVVLRRRGHTVTLVASESYEPLARFHGLAFHSLVSAAENHELLGHPDFWNPFKTARLSARWGLRYLRRQYALLSTLASPDTVFVGNPGVLAATLVSETRNLPLASLVLQPWVIPSSIAPPTMPRLAFLTGAPPIVWKGFWLALDGLVQVLMGRGYNRLRAELGLQPIRRMMRHWLSRQRIIGLFPEWFGPPAPDWPSQIRLAGFPLFDGGRNDELPLEILSFLRAGPPPIVFTFGTGMLHSAALFSTALDTCRTLGARGILLTKHRDQLPASLPASVVHLPFARFQALFPHCAAVVHHGGIGTMAEAMAAGIPQLIRPISFDQPDNGTRVKRLGLGDILSETSPNGKQMATALGALLNDRVRDRCRAIALRCVRGVALEKAADEVEALMPKRI